MRGSKALKPGNPYEEKEGSLWLLRLQEKWYKFPPVKWYGNLRVFIRRCKRSWLWVKNCIWTNWDFDALTIYNLLEYKLVRVQKNLENGYAYQESRDMKALRIAIKLAKRLANDYHETKMYQWHEEKWGELSMSFTPCDDGSGHSVMNSKREKAVTPEEKAAELEDLRRIWVLEPKWRERDEKLFFAIIQKHIRNWWD